MRPDRRRGRFNTVADRFPVRGASASCRFSY
jgi:hypothetical protein